MATKEELFVSLSPEVYRSGKTNILMSQANLLSTLKRIHNLRVLSRQKNDLKERLHRLFESTLSEIETIQNRMPTPKVPKTVHQKHEEPEQIPRKNTFPRRHDIEEELITIQEKLQQLNG